VRGKISPRDGVANPVLHEKGTITADIALKLGEYFGISPDLWLGLQIDYESRIAKPDVFKFPHPVNVKHSYIEWLMFDDSRLVWRRGESRHFYPNS
jgi:hypothetical protein